MDIAYDIEEKIYTVTLEDSETTLVFVTYTNDITKAKTRFVELMSERFDEAVLKKLAEVK